MTGFVPLADGGRLAFATEGAGAPLLLLRPLGGSIVSWEPFATLLARRVRVVTFDPRGAGCSSPAPWPTTTRSMARDATAVLDHLEIRRVAVYGLSLGGMVATWLALEHPDRVGRLVLASTPVRGWIDALGGWRRGLDLAGCLARPPRAAEACLAAAVLSEAFRAAHPDEVARIQERARARPASHRGLLTLLGAALAHDVRDRIGALESRTLVLAGADDELLPPEGQRATARMMSDAQFVTVPGVGHDLSAEAPSAVASLVLHHVLAA
jgi:3-oxoadipate enol-lactonase